MDVNYLKALDTAVLAAVVIDANKKIIFVNECVCKLFQYSKEELVGQNVKILTPPHIAMDHDGYVDNYLNGGEKKVIGTGRNVIGQKKDGTPVPMLLSVSEIIDDTTSEKYFLGLIQDLTTQHGMEMKYQKSLDSAVLAAVIIDSNKIITFANQATCDLFQYTKEELIGNNVKMITPPHIAKDHDQYVSNYLNTGHRKIIGTGREVTGRKKDGTSVKVLLSVSEIFDEGSGEKSFLGLMQDLTKQKTLERKYNVLKDVNIVCWNYFAKTNKYYWDKELFEYYDIRPTLDKTMDLETWIDFIHPDDRFAFKVGMKNIKQESNTLDALFRIITPNGSMKVLRMSANSTFDDNGNLEYIDGISMDVSEKIKYMELKDALNIDSLTKVNSRYYFDNELKYTIAQINHNNDTKSFALIMINIKGFKKINEYYGHKVGDKILQEFALSVKDGVRTKRSDVFARLSGDEFAVICRGVESKEETCKIVKRLESLTNNVFVVDGVPIDIGAIIGVVFYTKETHEDLLKYADYCISLAKKSDVSTIYFDEGIRKKYNESIQIIKLAKEVIIKKDFYMLYQPIVNIIENKVVGMEALLRPNLSTEVDMDKFINAVETNGLAGAVNEMVLDRVLDFLVTIKPKNEMFFSINVSPSVPDLYNHLIRLIAIVEQKMRVIHPNVKMKFELLETCLVKISNELLKDLINRMNIVGVKLAMDDFGAGYSSFGKVMNMGFSTIKIDKSLTDKLTKENKDAQNVFKALKNLGDNNVKMVVEGVETEEQLKLIRDIGYIYVQGYYFSKPNTIQALRDAKVIDL